MADKRISDLGAPAGGVASADKMPLVDVSDTSENAAGSLRGDTLANIITKGHGLSDGMMKVASGIMAIAVEGTDYWKPGGTDVAVADGGTGASTAGGARTNLGLVIGTNVQAYDADLADLAGITPAQGDVIYRNATNWVNLPAGTAGQFLSTGGSGANPSWVSGALATYDAIVAASGGTHTTLGAAVTAGARNIYVKDGTYTETGHIIPGAQIVVTGESHNAIIDLVATYEFRLGNFANSLIQNVCFKSPTSDGCILLQGPFQRIRNCYFDYNTSSGFALTVGLTTAATNAIIEQNVFNKTTAVNAGSAIQLGAAASGLIIRDNKFRGYCSGIIAMGTSSNDSCYILNNEVNSSASNGNIISQSANNGGSAGIIIANNTFTKPSGTGIAIDMTCTGGIIANNYFALNVAATAMNITGSRWEVDNNKQFSGGHFVNSIGAESKVTNNSIEVGGSAKHAIVTGGNECIVSNNYINQAGSGTTYAVDIGGDDNIVTGNFIKGFNIGVRISTSAFDRTVINANTFTSTNTTPISDSGTGTRISENTGVSPLMDKATMYVKNTSGATIAVGDIVTYKAVAAGDEITTTTTGGDNKVMGVALYSISNNAYGYIQTLGKTVTMKVDGTTDIAVGDFISTFTTVGIGQKATAGHTAIAIALEAYTANDSLGVIDALIIVPRII